MFTQAILFGAFALGTYAQGSSSSSASLSSASSSGSAAAKSSSVHAQTTLNLFVGRQGNEQFVGSIISADSCSTLIGLACTAGQYNSAGVSASCDPANTVTATYGPGLFEISSATQVNGAKATIVESCSLAGTTSAVCSASVYVSADGQHTASSTISTVLGTDIFAPVPITAGASKISGLGQCTATAGSGAAPTGISEVYKVIVVPAAAALLAGAFM